MSQWWPYIQNLPKRFTVPIFYTSEEIQALQYLPLTHQAGSQHIPHLSFRVLTAHNAYTFIYLFTFIF